MDKKNSTQDISDKPREHILETTQEQYDEMKARGIDEDAIPSVGKHVFRRRTSKINPSEAKIKLTMFIDGDILQHFRKRAEKPKRQRVPSADKSRTASRDGARFGGRRKQNP